MSVPQHTDGGRKTTYESPLPLPCGTAPTSPKEAASALVFSAIYQSSFILSYNLKVCFLVSILQSLGRKILKKQYRLTKSCK